MNSEQKTIEQAAEWVLLLDESSPEEFPVKSWKSWMKQSEAHRSAFKKMLVMWGSCDQLNDASQTNSEVVTQTLGEVTYLKPKNSKKNTFFKQHWQQAIAASLFVAVIVPIISSFTNKLDSINHSTASYETVKSETKAISLSDGTKIELGVDSHVETEFTKELRKVRLVRGELFIEVSKDKERPLWLYSNNSIVKVVGTAFHINKTSHRTTISVIEGIVDVGVVDNQDLAFAINKPEQLKATSSQRLLHHEQVFVSSQQGMSAVNQFDDTYLENWRQGKMVFVKNDLRSVSETLSRYVDFSITVDDSVDPELLFSGSVSKGNISEWLDVLPEVFNVQISKHGDDVFISM